MQTLSPRTWTFSIIGFLILLVMSNAVIWHFFTRDLLTFEPYYNGGLDRLGYVFGSKHYRKPETTLPLRHIEGAEYRGGPIDVLTIGDSFSNDRDNGRDPLYQDWIASLHELTVMNIQPLKHRDKLTTLAILLNSGYIDTVRPRFIVLETVERYCVSEYAKPLDLAQKLPLAEIEEFYRSAEYRFSPPKVFFLNSGNFKFIFYSMLYRFSDHAFFSPVTVRNLSKPFFSARNGDTLLVISEDMKSIPLATQDRIRTLNANINMLAKRFREKGITLYFMPAADKYTMYSSYILDNPYPESVFFELLRTEPREYVLVDTKALLQELIEKGEKDVYYSDDTHWSWKASRKIAESMRFNVPSRPFAGAF